MTVDEGQDVKVRFRLEYRLQHQSHRWQTMYHPPSKGSGLVFAKTIEEAKIERTKAIKRHKPYGRDYVYRIVKVTEEVVG